MTRGLVVELLGPRHDRAAFNSGVEPLDRYLRNQAGQDARRRISSCFVAVERGGTVICGYYTLAMSSIRGAELPEGLTRKLPRYPSIPAALLGRLAVDARYQGEGIGGALLGDAGVRASRSEIAAFALLVHPKDDGATAFYRHHGFASLAGGSRALFLPLEPVRARNAE